MGKNIILRELKKQHVVVENVEPNTTTDNIIENIKRVYNVSVEDSNEYFANNILVHNCDALALICKDLNLFDEGGTMQGEIVL